VAYQVLISRGEDGGGRVATPKIRNPWAVALLHFVPIYGLYWYYSFNVELRDTGRALNERQLAESRPLLSLLAVFPGGLLILPALISYYRSAVRVRLVQRALHLEHDAEIKPWLVGVNTTLGVLFVFPALYAFGLMQARANRGWRLYDDAWGMATGDAADFVWRTGRAEVPLCAACIANLFVGTPELERGVYLRRDAVASSCDLCSKPLPGAAELAAAN
jgi:hypothetical protein